nr:hypothetical protein [Tanacetum cinerariifolium]
PPSHTKEETEDIKTGTKKEKPKEPKIAVPISFVKAIKTLTPEAQPITTIISSQPESTQAPKRVDKGKKIAIVDVKPQVKLVPALKVEVTKKAVEQARLLAITKPEVVKVVREEAEKIGIDLERISNAKEGEKFKKAQDAKLKVHNKERS